MRIRPKRPILRAQAGVPYGGWGCWPPQDPETRSNCIPPWLTSPGGVNRNPQHADGDEWWQYSADLDDSGLWAQIAAVAPPGFTYAHTGDVQWRQTAGLADVIRIHVSGHHNGKWYNCVLTYSWNGGGENDAWVPQSCVEQAGGGNAMQYQHPGFGYTTPLPGYEPSRNSIFRRITNRVMGRR